MARLGKSVAGLQKGARVISLRPISAPEPSETVVPSSAVEDVVQNHTGKSRLDGRGRASGGRPVLRLLHEGVFRMSWQMARVYIYVRL